MKKTKIISKVLFVIARSLTWIYFITSIYGLVSLITNINLQTDEHKIIVEYPFTDISFLILDNSLNYVLFAFLLPMLSYALFFWLLSNVFKVFLQDKLFTKSNIIHLKRFYLTNIFLPILLVTFSSFFIEVENGIIMITALHLLLGVFIFIFSEIFNQGLTLQNEHDLYI